jgi:hypothetical protein
MECAQTFEKRPPDVDGRLAALAEAVERLPEGPGRTGAAARQPGPAAADAGAAIPVLEPLVGLLPEGLRRGDAVAITARDRAPDYLTLALLAGALAKGLWCAVVGVPEFGVLALAGLLGDTPEQSGALDRLLLVPDPGERWAEVLAALADGVDLLLARPGTAVSAEIGRRVDARLRQGRSTGTGHSAALLVLGRWDSARLVLRTVQTIWTGLDGTGPTAGTGHLSGGRATIVAEGRATAGRPRTVRLWLPTAAGTARSLTDSAPSTAPVTPAPPRLTVAA